MSEKKADNNDESVKNTSDDIPYIPRRLIGNLRLLNRYTICLCIVCLLINFLGVRLTSATEIPLFFDCIGTILAAALGGYIPGIIVGFFSNIINSIFDHITLYYGLVNALIGLTAAFFAERCAFRSIRLSLVTVPVFSVIGGGIGSVMTWMLYGFNFGSGISQNMATALYEQYGLGKFISQFVADFTIDLADKLIVVAIVYIVLLVTPQRLLSRFPLGGIYDRSKPIKTILNTQYLMLSKDHEAIASRFFRRHSLRRKVANLIILTAIVLGIISVTIGYAIYQDTMLAHYTDTCNSIVELMVASLDGDKTDFYLTNPDSDEYREAEEELERILHTQTNIQYMYVYRITPAGCMVVFDLDTQELAGEEVGTIIVPDQSFEKYLPYLYAGKEIEPVISNDQYGWLLTVYHPIKDSNGIIQCYAAADIDMQMVISDRYIFVSRMISLLFGASIIIVCFAIWYAQKRIVDPINAITLAAHRFAYDSEENRRSDTAYLSRLNINTGDEIENLYGAVKKTFTDVTNYIEDIDEKNRELEASADTISRLQNNIIISFAGMIENRDENTGGHIKRTAAYVGAIGERLLADNTYKDFTRADFDDYVRAAPLHDIGKIKIPDSILNKPGKLTAEEYEIIKTHTTLGYQILGDAFRGIESEGYIVTAENMALYHHERWDGTGYPKGLRGDEIPLCARLMTIADVFDALISKRAYKDACTFDEAVQIINSSSGSHFDPRIVEAFTQILAEMKQISEMYK